MIRHSSITRVRKDNNEKLMILNAFLDTQSQPKNYDEFIDIETENGGLIDFFPHENKPMVVFVSTEIDVLH